MTQSPTTRVAPDADGRLRGSSLSAPITPAVNHSGTFGRRPPAPAGRIGSRTGLRRIQMGCAGPRRLLPTLMGAWRSWSWATIFNPRDRDLVAR